MLASVAEGSDIKHLTDRRVGHIPVRTVYSGCDQYDREVSSESVISQYVKDDLQGCKNLCLENEKCEGIVFFPLEPGCLLFDGALGEIVEFKNTIVSTLECIKKDYWTPVHPEQSVDYEFFAEPLKIKIKNPDLNEVLKFALYDAEDDKNRN